MTSAEQAPAIGQQLGALLARLAHGGDRQLLAATVALLLEERQFGHVCIRLDDWADSGLNGS